jgi:hypothetical protein
MKNQKNQNSIEKKSKTRKNNVESNRKITDFFSNFLIEGDNTNVIEKNNYHKNRNNEDGTEQEEKFIDLYGDFNSSLILNYRNQNENYNYNNSNKKKIKKKNGREKFYKSKK